MKKLLTALIALMLIAALATTALATTMYIQKDKALVYRGPSKDSEKYMHLPFGGTVDVVETSGKWSHINFLDKNSVPCTGWIPTKHLSSSVPCKHNWGDWKVIRKATCSAVGMRQRTCSKCGKKQTEDIDKVKHTWGKWSVTTKATCAKTGEKTRKCSVCGKKQTKKIDKTTHTYGDWTVDKEATCAEAGSRTRTCSICGNKQTESIDPLPHTFGAWTVIVPLTREADGERASTCAVCGNEVRETLKAEPAFVRKDRGEGVRAAQTMLDELGYDAGRADGIYGPKLDRAFSAFAGDKGLTFAEGWLKPAQLDALASAWAASVPEEKWMGEGDEDAPVQLVLTVDAADNASGARSFNWILTNNGSQSCTMKALLMGTGADHDFRGDSLVVVMDSEALKTGEKHALGGSFSVPEDLGEGVEALSFRAVVESDKTGETWLSNAVVYPLGE